MTMLCTIGVMYSRLEQGFISNGCDGGREVVLLNICCGNKGIITHTG